jgi:hypothetical protein
VTTFAAIEDLEEYIGTTLPPARAELMLELATSAVINAAGVPVVQVVDDVATIDGNGSDRLLLPNWPVTAVSTVTVDGTALAADRWNWSRYGEIRRTSGRWPFTPGAVQVTYTHGYPEADIPTDLKAIVLQVAARTVANPQRLNSFGDGQVTAGYGGGGTGVQVIELYRTEHELVQRALR